MMVRSRCGQRLAIIAIVVLAMVAPRSRSSVSACRAAQISLNRRTITA
jgi:hypothetical protein